MKGLGFASVVKLLGETEIGNDAVARGVQEDVFRLQISEYYAVPMSGSQLYSPRRCSAVSSQILQSQNQIRRVKPRPYMTQRPRHLQLRRQIPTGIEVHDKVEVLAVGKGVVETGDKVVMGFVDGEALEDGKFSEDVWELV
jgi:hypothetical protein